MSRVQYGIIVAALSIAAWVLLTTPWTRARKGPVSAAGGAGAVAAQPGEERTVKTAPAAVPASAVTVLSSPPGAQVYLDGEKKGVTPVVLPPLDPAVGHAITVEKKCYRSWQVALPPRAGPRQFAATLQGAAGACPGSHLEATGMPAPPGLPDEAAAAATLGFLNLGSRPGAQVLIDGVDIGRATPLVAWPLRNGPHKVRLVSRGGAREVPIEIRAGETHSEMVELAPPPQKSPKKRRGRR